MKLPTKHIEGYAMKDWQVKDNEIIDFLDSFIRNAEKCCVCNGCPRHPKEETLAQKFQAFREKRGNGQGRSYWEGLEDIANEYYHQL